MTYLTRQVKKQQSCNIFRYIEIKVYGTRKAEVLNSLIINTTAKANDTTDILQTFR